MPFDAFQQYERLLKYKNIKNVKIGVVLYLYEKDIVMYIPLEEIEKMKAFNKKSVGLKAIAEGYNIIQVPSRKKRTLMESDYTCLLDEENCI